MHFWLLPCLEQALFVMIIILRHNPGLLYFHIHLCWSFIRNLWQQIQYSFCWDPSFSDHGFCNWRGFNKRYNVATYSFVTMFFFSWWKLHWMVRIPGLQCDLWQRDSGSLKKLHQSTSSTWGKELLGLWAPCRNKGVQLKRMSK